MNSGHRPMNKAEVRALIRCRKQSITAEDLAEKSRILTKQFLETDAYRNAKTLYGYISYNREVCTAAILEQAMKDGKRVAIPKCYGKQMLFRYVTDLNRVEYRSFGLPEPYDDEPLAQDPEALVLMPGLAFDRAGRRIGYGGGYYDRFLELEPNHPTIALCFDFQLLDHLDTDPFDIPADLVLWA